MPRLTRKNIKVFAGSATNNGVFGSLQANNPTTTSDVEQLQSLSAWSEGWNAATETSEELPPLEEIQGVEYVTTYQQAYIMQEGVPEWSVTVTYYKGCLTKEVTSTGFKIYNSLTDNNTGNLLSDTSNWKKVMDSDDLYAFDNTVVHKTGDETITGVKTFTDDMITDDILPKGSITLGTSTNTWGKQLQFRDTTGKRIARIQPMAIDTTNNRVGMWVNNADNTVEKGIYVDSNGTTSAPTPTAGDNSTKIATTAFVQTAVSTKANDSNVVHKTGDEIISGQKIFTDKVEIRGANGYILFHIVGTMFTRLQESANGLEVRTGDGVNLAPLFVGDSDTNHSVVVTTAKSKASNGYFKLGNGLIIQWGKSTATSSSGNVTLPTPFTSTNYAVIINDVMANVPSSQASNANVVGWGVIQSRSTTSFSAFICNYENSYWWRWGEGRSFTWIAIGY